jgi:hypothetical protein
MSNEKKILEKKITFWVKKFVNSLENYKLIEIIQDSNLSKINSENVKQFSNYNNWDFIPDFAVIIVNKKENSKFEIILINRETKAVGLRSIGQIMSYNKLVNPKFSFLITDKGHSNEISYFMINDKIRSRLMSFGKNSLIIFSFDSDASASFLNLKRLLNVFIKSLFLIIVIAFFLANASASAFLTARSAAALSLCFFFAISASNRCCKVLEADVVFCKEATLAACAF